jgi:N-succinyl-L-ornithine transcarbamylase
LNYFTSVHELSVAAGQPLSAAIPKMVEQALRYKENPQSDCFLGKGKRIGLIFLNPSLRTRISTQIAAENIGLHPIVFNAGSEGWSWELEDGVVMNGTSVEHIKDAAAVLGSYFDLLALRTFPTLNNKEADYSEIVLNQFIRYAGVPVISLESATRHPLQSFADVITICETHTVQKKPKIVLAWAPHIKALPQCVANSFAEWINAWGTADFVITHPEGYELDEQFTAGATISVNQQQALEGADFIYVKNWSSYKDYGKVLRDDSAWMLTEKKLDSCPHAKIMHCLPVRRNVELADELLDSERSLVTQQAANRIWAAQTVLASILKANG